MVDDVVRYHRLYEMAITDAIPAQVTFAVNGEEALKRLAGPLPFDLLILDLNMPKLNGEETLKRIRQDPSFDTLPVVILTGDTDQETHRRLLEIGADDFVEKGSPPEIFVSRLKAQMRHKLALDRLTRLAVDMDIFAAGVLHDIRNLETNIITVCELARNYLQDDPRGRQRLMIEDFTALVERSEQLGKYAAEIIQMVRETHTPLTQSAQDLPQLIAWAAKMGTPTRQGARATVKYKSAVPLKPVLADRHFLQLALLNIVQNAVKYSRPDVPPELEIDQRPGRDDPSTPNTQTVVTSIRDNGVGLKQGDLRRIFDPFTRGSGVGREVSGFGLGLSLVQKVVTAMDGRVWAELPTSGPGAVFCLELPVALGL